MTAFGSCEWPVLYQCGEGDAGGYWDGKDSDERERWETVAIEFLSDWTGNRFGVCEASIRPCRQDCFTGGNTFYGRGPWTAQGTSGTVGCGSCASECACSSVPSLKLAGPIVSIDSITIDGVVLPTTAYRVEDHYYLIRTDGGDWPICQDFSVDEGVGVFEINYQRGVPVPVGGQVAAGILAVEFHKASCNDATCQLPRRLSSVTRQGVTIDILDTFEDLDTGRTGIWMIDSWVASVTKPLSTPSRVYSPDLSRRRPRRTTFGG